MSMKLLNLLLWIVALFLGACCWQAGEQWQIAWSVAQAGYVPLSFVGWVAGATGTFISLMWISGSIADHRREAELRLRRLRDDIQVENAVELLIEEQRTPVARLNRANSVTNRRRIHHETWWGGHWWRK